MKRIACLMMLTALSTPASARDSYSFVVHGHRVHIEASQHCRSLSCVSVSIPGVGNWHHDRDVATVNDPASAPTSAPQTAQPTPSAQPQAQPVYTPPVAQVTPAPAQPAPSVTRAPTIPPPTAQAQPAPVAPPSPPVQSPPAAQPAQVPAPRLAAAAPPPAPPAAGTGFETTKPQQSAVPPASAATPQQPAKPQQSIAADKPEAKPQDQAQDKQDKPAVEQPTPPVARASQQTDSNTATPIGDWQTEGKNGTVRIEACGPALCGYMLNTTAGTKGESVLVNMKPKSGSDSQWTGNVYSRSSGNSYYGTMTLKEAKTLRVEACALGSFLCSGNNWTRLEESRSVQPDEVANSRRTDAPEPRS